MLSYEYVLDALHFIGPGSPSIHNVLPISLSQALNIAARRVHPPIRLLIVDDPLRHTGARQELQGVELDLAW